MTSYLNCPAVIYDEEGELIAKVMILDHDRKNMSVTLSDSLSSVRAGTRLSVLVIHAEGAAEMSATARSAIDGNRELALYNQRSRAGRAAPRRTTDMPAFIKTRTIGENTRNFRPPYEVLIKNISATGMLINATTGFFTVGQPTEIIIIISGAETLLRGKIVREVKNPDVSCDYGFKFMSKDD